MDTIIEKIQETHPDEEVVSRAGSILRAGGLVAIPTETVYGLAADALDEEAATRIYAAKGRPSDNPLIVHITKMEDLEVIAAEIPDIARQLAEKFWPGPLTMIFRKTDRVPYGTTGGLDTVAVRMPSNKISRAVIESGGGFLAAPSANTSGRPSPTTAAHVIEDLNGKIEMIVDGGATGIGLESTIVDVTAPVPVILRPGYVTKAMIEEVTQEVVMDSVTDGNDKDERPKAPGMKYKHYAPRAEIILVDGQMEEVIRKINQFVENAQAEGKRAGIIATQESRDSYPHEWVRCIGTRADEETIAHNLFQVLRSFDQDQVDVIYSEVFFQEGIGHAIMNRLCKAAGNHVIHV